MVIRIALDRSSESANWIKSVRDSDRAEKYKKKHKKLKKSEDLPELLTLLATTEYLAKQSGLHEEWVTGFVPPEKRYYHPEGKHEGPREGNFSIIGTEVDQHGKALRPPVQLPPRPGPHDISELPMPPQQDVAPAARDDVNIVDFSDA